MASSNLSVSPGKAVAGILISVACFAVPLFVTAGTLDWWQAWVVVGIDVLTAVVAMIDLPRVAPGLIEERMNPLERPGQPLVDRIVFAAIILVFFGIEIASAIDVFRVRVLPDPGTAVSTVGLIAFVLGWAIIYVAMRQNAFASAVVRYQSERSQKVVDSGFYAHVRHPMYLGALLFMFGLPLWLHSYLGALVALSILPLGALRIRTEEAVLQRELPGYDDYARRVRYRLIPGVW